MLKERPVLMNGAMVRATLAGTKTQTRRVIKPHPEMVADKRIEPWKGDPADLLELLKQNRRHCPYGQVGDRLWVRETLGHHADKGHYYAATGTHIGPILDYELEPSPSIGIPARTIPSIHMPRWASRILLEIISLRVERLQDISESDAIAEGIEKTPQGFWSLYGQHDSNGTFNPRTSFRALWQSINGADSWAASHWVWVVEFKRVAP